MTKEEIMETEAEMKKHSLERGMKLDKRLKKSLVRGDYLEFATTMNAKVFMFGTPSSVYSEFFEKGDFLSREELIKLFQAGVRVLNQDLHERGYDFSLSQDNVYDLLEVCGFYGDLDSSHRLKVRCAYFRHKGEKCEWEACEKCKEEITCN